MPNNNLLFDTVKLGSITIDNRVGVAPMTRTSATPEGVATDEMVNYYAKFARGGFSLIITEGTYPDDAYSQGYFDQPGIINDEQIKGWKKVTDAVHQEGGKIILQLMHAGALSQGNRFVKDSIGPSVVEPKGEQMKVYGGNGKFPVPKEATKEDIKVVIKGFAEAAKNAKKAGFDGVEIHGAHGFLLQNFFSPFFNRREDEWGGSLENRLRFPLAVVQEIKNVIKKHTTKPFILGYRISPDEHQAGGLRMKDTYELINRLIEANVDYVHASLANALSSKPVDSQDDKTYLELIVDHVNGRVPVLAAGSMVTPDDVKMALDKGLTLAAIGHALIMNPDWIEKVQNGNEADIKTAIRKSKVSELELPEKLWTAIQASGPWFKIEE
ncbi:NADH:flavin oxidoreductase [Priestia megaterium]|uniref:oxidoreductase n=1 Tax=Priestia megaterium TaxID=1404 RepID=UPI002FFEDDBC